VGRSRLEALAVLACGAIMMFANIEIIQYSVVDLVQGVNGDIPTFNTNWYIYGLLGVGIVLKLVLWTYCVQVQKATASDSVKALAEDHLNDVMSNSVAVVCLSIAAEQKSDPNLWWFDALGAVLISGVIIYRWYEEGSEQVEKIVGRSAPPEFISDVEKLAVAYDKRVEVDCTRAYHCGARFHVEMEIVLPGELPLKETHDIALIIQHKIEKKQEVERAFVHVDYKIRDGLEHKVERELVTGSKNLTKQTPPGAEALVNPETCAAAPHLEGSDHGVIQDYA
jgi:cation diffusion facilitator family transporter